MISKVECKNLRDQRGFSWFVDASNTALRYLAGIPLGEFYLSAEACIEAYHKGLPLFEELFGPEVGLPAFSTPLLKYGHINALGAELKFPKGGEPHHSALFGSPEEGIEHFKKQIDFATAGMTPFYLDYYKKMQQAFPDEQVYFGWQWEGPVTTAWGLLGGSFMYDLFDRPEALAKFMKLCTQSIVEYCRFFCEVISS